MSWERQIAASESPAPEEGKAAEPTSLRAASIQAAMQSFDTLPRSLDRQRLYFRVIQDPAFLSWLTDVAGLSRNDRLKVCHRLMGIDPFFDVRLMRMLPASENEDATLCVLDTLDEISPGARLIMTLSRLMRHPDKRVASKAALLLGRRVRNQVWVERHLGAEDSRLRANVVEALWGKETAFARQTLRTCLNDSHNRVVGNALIGLHLLGDAAVPDLLVRMLEDTRAPFRSTAAWAMGRTGQKTFREPLERALNDPNSKVREAARKALRVIAQPAMPEPARPPEGDMPAPAVTPDEIPPANVETPAPRPEIDLRLDGHFLANKRNSSSGRVHES